MDKMFFGGLEHGDFLDVGVLLVVEVVQIARTRPRASLRSLLPPRGLLVASFAESEGMPPALRAAPQNGGRSRGFLNVCVLRRGASRSAVSFMRAPDANLDAKFLAKKPTKLGGQRRRRGGRVLAFCKTFKKSKTPTDHPTPGLPSSRTKAIQEPRSKLTSDQHVAI
jgi:hypothetical protein